MQKNAGERVVKMIDKMKTVIIHGQSHQGTTCHIARALAEKIGGDTKEFFLPRDFGAFCTGCTACFMVSERKCPHYQALAPITNAIDAADVIILASPVYVYHATGAMKAFLDHYGYRWMVHSPEPTMFMKQGVCISTAAGAGMKSTNRDMADSLFYWGVARIYKVGMAVAATNWDMIRDKKKATLDRKISRLARQIRDRHARGVQPAIKTKALFSVMRLVQKKGWNERDVRYWKEHGWLGRERPWKASHGV